MPVRDRLRRLLGGTDDDLSLEIDDLRAALARETAARKALEARADKLDKRLGMAMGAVQAATAQLMQIKSVAEEARTAASQANQRATSALSTAESAADAVAER
jgi:methyl-accepting chemotaxis protein